MDTLYCEFIGLRQTSRLLNNETAPRVVSTKDLVNKLNNQDFLSVLYILKFIHLHLTILSERVYSAFLRLHKILKKSKFKINQVTQEDEPLNHIQEDNANYLSTYEIFKNGDKVMVVTRICVFSS